MSNASKAKPPISVQFTYSEDRKKYPGKWIYDEAAIMRLPARRLIQLESALGMPVVDMMNGVRLRTILGDLAAAWVAIHLADPSVAGDFDEFNPLIMMAEWKPAGSTEGKAEAGMEATPTDPAMPRPEASTSPPENPEESMTSGQKDTVVLQSLPILE